MTAKKKEKTGRVRRFLPGKPAGRHLLVWAIVFLSFAVCVLISALHIKQQTMMNSAIDSWDDMRRARNALSRGMVMILDGSRSRSRQEILLGIALARQATDFYSSFRERAVFPNADWISTSEAWASELTTRSRELNGRLEKAAKGTGTDSFELAIAYQNLDRQAGYANSVAHRMIIDLSRHNDAMFIAILWICAGILLFMCGAVFMLTAAGEKSRRELTKNQRLLQSIIDSTPSPVYAYDRSGRCILSNRFHAELFGMTPSEIIGKTRSDFSSDSSFMRHAENDQKVFSAKTVITRIEQMAVGPDEHTFFTVKVPLYDDSSGIFAVGGVSTDITEITLKEKALASALEEKEILIKELYHRTKNNMQVIHSMLRLQSRQSGSDEVKRNLRDAENRIYAMALVHQKLYEGHDLSHISLKEYIGDFAHTVITGVSQVSGRIRLDLDIDDIEILLDTAIPCGLVLNELITNSVKHAFPDGRSGIIRIEGRVLADGILEILYSDDGIGVPEGFDFRNQKSLGMTIIHSIAELQMRGSVSFSPAPGLRCRFTMNMKLYSERV